MNELIQDAIFRSARPAPGAEALVDGARRLSYAELADSVARTAAGLRAAGLETGERLAVYLDKSVENVCAMFGAAAAGAVFVPVNPQLRAAQVAYIMADCEVRVLVTTPERLRLLAPVLGQCPGLRTVVVCGAQAAVELPEGIVQLAWDGIIATPAPATLPRRRIDADPAAILYTSGSTGNPKGVVLSHRNMVAGADSVVSYLGNNPSDRILAVLPLSFDYGLSQLTTAFASGATAVLINYLLPRDILKAVGAERITGLAAVPSLWLQLAQLPWPADCSLRYLTNSGGAMPRAALDALRAALPNARPFLMYGLTEAFRSTYLAPEELERRPDSIGKAIPNAEVLVLRADGTHCEAGEPGELVHRGALVALGYWNDAAKTAERFKPLPPRDGLALPEIAVWSGDTVRRDEEGFLYFISRKDEMIKTSGYRVSPTEVEEIVYGCDGVLEAAAFGAPHPALGQAIVVVAWLREGAGIGAAEVLAHCKRQLPGYMTPSKIVIAGAPLPRNPNGKFDRKQLSGDHQQVFGGGPQ
ncbi:MAG: acyl-CoA ligase (AMP-forming), exosortase A system-associated [Telluria sp.]